MSPPQSKNREHKGSKPVSRAVNLGQDDNEDALGKLPEAERTILKRQIDTPVVKTSYLSLFRYASPFDFLCLVVALFCSVAAGIAYPLMSVVFGQFAGKFEDQIIGTITPEQFSKDISRLSLFFLYLGIGDFVTVYISTVLFSLMSDSIAQKIKERYLAASLRQNIGFFDHLGNGEITTRITSDMDAIQDGIGRKVGITLTAAVTFLAAFVIGFIKSWKLTLILCSVILALFVLVGVVSIFLVKYEANAVDSYALGGTVAEETLSSIRNSHAFNTEEKIASLYETHLQEAKKWGFRSKATLAVVIAMVMGAFFLTTALCFWEGTRLLLDGELDLSTIVTVLQAVLIGAINAGNVAPHIQAFTKASASASKIFATIERSSPLDSSSSNGDCLSNMKGTIELRNIRHIYPSRPEMVVLEDFSLICPQGKVTALVGPSGAGKSSIISLLERFHDPVRGQIFLDGVDISTLNLKHLRQNISLVSQEPVLFNDTIFNNIAHGLIGTDLERIDREAKFELVRQAASMANASQFINKSPLGYDSRIGERGLLLSGGQKQRIVIARAIVSNPKVLLLDEATSALDSKSERLVQIALDRVSKGRTTIVIAHRLSTIKSASNIVVMQKGKIAEQGSHQELIEKRGAYYDLVDAQQISDEDCRSQALHEFSPNIQMAEENSAGTLQALNPGETVNATNTVSQEVKPRYSFWTVMKLVLSFNDSEKLIMFLGLFGSTIAGGGFPTEAVFFGKSIEAITLSSTDPRELKRKINFWSGMYLMLAFVQIIAYLLLGFAFAYCAELLVYRFRNRAFRTMLRQDVAFFDKDENSSSALTAFLSTRSSQMTALSGPILGSVLTFLTTLIAGTSLALAVGWKLGLVCLALLPLVLASGILDMKSRADFEAIAVDFQARAATGACEALAAIRTVAALTKEGETKAVYHTILEDVRKKSFKASARISVLFGLSQSIILPCLGLVFWYGGTLIKTGEYGVFQFFLCLSAVIFGFQAASGIFALTPGLGKAKQAAEDLKTLFDRKPVIDLWSQKGQLLTELEGRIELRDISFEYPLRPGNLVLRDLSLSIEPGQYVALVGASGCGKSTIISLIERFYDPSSGSIKIDGWDISELNLKQYRSFVALVAQEPTLYQGSIRENILFGTDQSNENVDDKLVEQACRNANIWDFVISLPDGLGTRIGAKGLLLSGGQKQRIAIARALIRNPRLLLLDEATAALDSDSERAVQEALDLAAKGRTTIAVAHRLSTIRKADIIYVIDEGSVVERGTHQELITARGRYFELVTLQSLR